MFYSRRKLRKIWRQRNRIANRRRWLTRSYYRIARKHRIQIHSIVN